MIGRHLDHSDVEELPEGNPTLSYLVILYFKHMVRGPYGETSLGYTENLPTNVIVPKCERDH